MNAIRAAVAAGAAIRSATVAGAYRSGVETAGLVARALRAPAAAE